MGSTVQKGGGIIKFGSSRAARRFVFFLNPPTTDRAKEDLARFVSKYEF